MNQQQLEVIETLKEYVPKLIKGILDVIEKVNDIKPRDTLNMTSEIIDGVQWVYEATALTIQNNRTDEDWARFNNILAEIVKSYEYEDSILTKDLLKYELLPLIEDIQEVLKKY